MNKHNIILVGCGSMANVWLDYVETKANATIVGLVDISEQSAQSLATKRQINAPIFTDLSEALNTLDADIVFDVTIPASHHDVVTTSLRAGCHVFGEKPMAESLDDAKNILDVVKETGKTYSVMQNRRFLKPIRSIRHFLDTGKIGTVGSIHANFFLGPHFGGFREAMAHPLIVDMAIHTFDQARYMIASDPVSVYCHAYNPPGSWYDGQASAICIFEMQNGATFTYNGSWCTEGLNTSWESEWRVTGSKGSVVWDGHDDLKCEVVDPTKESGFISPVQDIAIPNVWHHQEEHFGCLDNMFAAIESGQKAETDSADNIHSMAMVFAAIKSAETGQKIRI